ncbi:MAG: metalloregulator ArsR/SmtB family transcription factor [Coprothermobacterota bacterium]|nr:metalloregulator ArsR/SmtB family transcription factor [Coprothermobacterota bacterium]
MRKKAWTLQELSSKAAGEMGGTVGDVQDLAQMFAALSNQSRLRIVNLLIEKALCVSDVARVLSLSQSNVSQHLTVLHNAGLVSVQRVGAFSLYRLTIPEPYRQLVHCLRQSRESFPLLQADLRKLRQVTEESEQARC